MINVMKQIYRMVVTGVAVCVAASAFTQVFAGGTQGGLKKPSWHAKTAKKQYGENWALRSIDLTKSIMSGMDLAPDQRAREEKLRNEFDARISMVDQNKVRDPKDPKPVEIKELAHDFRIQMMAILTPIQQNEFKKRWSADMKASKIHRAP